MSGAGQLPPELRDAAESAPRRGARVRRVVQILLAVGLAAALTLSGCTILPSLFSGSGAAQPAHEPGDLPETPDGTVAGFGAQEPDWNPCDTRMQCADVYAPLDWDDPAGETIALRLVKREATGAARGTLFINPGGPGSSGADYVASAIESVVPAEIRESYDVVGWDPRGVGASTPVTCLTDAEMDDYLFGIDAEWEELATGSDAWIDHALAEAAEYGDACAERSGDLIAHVDTMSTVHDLDMLRAIVGDAALNYLGFSYGTYIGARYADAFPERVGRVVLDGAMEPTATMADVVREQTLGFEQALRAYADDCLGRRGCPLTGTGDEAMAQVGAMLDAVDADPVQGSDGRWVSASTFLTAIILPLYDEASWGYLDDLFADVPNGDVDLALALADSYYDRDDGTYGGNSTEAFSAINCLDYPRALDREQMRAEAAELAEVAPTLGKFQGYGDISCAAWPVAGVEDRPEASGSGAAPILVVGTTGDPATPYQWAQSLAAQLRSGVLVTYEGEGHTAYGSSACVSDVVDDYLLTGAVPDADPRCTS